MKDAQPPLRVSAALTAIVACLVVVGFHGRLASQTQDKVDYVRDVQLILTQRCISCHGPSRQMNGYRLDRRSAALGGLVRHNIVAGSGESSRLYHRVIGNEFGPQMPPTGALAPEEIAVLKRWIDEGAEWPDALANEAESRPAEPETLRVIDMIRGSDPETVLHRLHDQQDLRAVVNTRGPGGSTPLMYAALYSDARSVARMLEAGADAKLRNQVGATALMWALDNVDTVRALLDGGADVNATSDFDRTPLTLAAAQAGSAPVVKLLLDRGAMPSATALAAAALHGNSAVVRMLLAAGARDTGAAATAALRSNCTECLDAIVSVQQVPPLRNALLSLLPAAGPGNSSALQQAIDRGADINVRDAKSRTVLMRAAIVDQISPDIVQLLIDRGADVHGRTRDGFTALDLARRSGHTPIVDVLTKAGAATASDVEPTLTFVRANTIPAALRRVLPLLQRTAVLFYQKSGCVSCHHNALTEMTVAAARQHGFAVDERNAGQDLKTVVDDIEATPDQALQGIVVGGGQVTTTGYVLMGLSAEHYQSNMATDAMVRLLRLSQQPDGHWLSAYRPPFESSEFTATAVSLRGIQLYGPNKWKEVDDRAIRAAMSWLANAHPQTTEDRVFRLFGLTWTQASPALRRSALHDLVATQRPDGGWAQLSSLRSDAYATGESLVALSEAGMRPSDLVYRRGVQFLLNTQLVDGSWFVRTRSQPTQSYFESGFPHGVNQFISTAATNWATQALVRGDHTRLARSGTGTNRRPENPMSTRLNCRPITERSVAMG
jgi:ankyrin repeat protein/mono/diheme cytochrome c family protein